uniref:Uncharacterized protein n=1 Tax=Arundo donax TaxID=35708 RepID=A0A0A9FYC4_ARUDO
MLKAGWTTLRWRFHSSPSVRTSPLPRRRAMCGFMRFLGYIPVRSNSTCRTVFTSATHTFGLAPVQYTNIRP